MSQSQRLGQRGEELAEAELRRRGMKILARNWRYRHKEVDLIAEDGDVVVFVEVKTRRGTEFGGPLAAVTWRKQRHLTTAAAAFLTERRWMARPSRFDVVGLVLRGDEVEIEHVRGAFDAGA